MKRMHLLILLFVSSICSFSQTYVNENIAILKDKLDGGFYQTKNDGHVYFRFDEKYNDGSLNFKVYNELRADITPVANNLTTGSVGSKAYGTNIYDLDLDGNSDFKYNHYYYLEVTDSKGKILKLRIFFKGNYTTPQ